MKIEKYKGRTYAEVKRELLKSKPYYCEGCGALCTQEVKVMNVLFDTDTGKQVKTYTIEIDCPRPWYKRIGSRGHMGDTVYILD